MPTEQYRDPRAIRKTEEDVRHLANDLYRLSREKREAAIQAAVRSHFIDEPITTLDTPLSKKLQRLNSDVLT